jgi:protein phosphatase 1 regulatory subunit 7
LEKTNRITNPETLNKLEIANNLSQGKEVILQFSQMPSGRLLSEINTLCELHTHQLTVRFFSFEDFDCAVLRHLPNVKSLEVDCIMRANNINVMTELTQLTRLNLGVFELKETEILAANNFKNLTSLNFGATKTKSVNLAPLTNLTQLEWLLIEGHTKNIEAISTLSQLKYLRLHGITKTSLAFVNALKQLKTLELTLGGRENLDEIEENTIERLIIGRVRGLSQINNLSQFTKLNYLFISEQLQLEAINFAPSSTLKAVGIVNCKQLHTLSNLAQLSDLRYLSLYLTALIFESIMDAGIAKSVQYFTFNTGNLKETNAISARLEALGYQEAKFEALEQVLA